MSNATPRVIREKETFKTEASVNIDGEEIRFFVKSSVNYERMTYKVSPIVTMVHKKSPEFEKALLNSVDTSRTECMNRLEKYREETGLGTQSEMNFGEPAGASA